MGQQSDKYAEDGVNIDVGDALSREAAEVCRATYDISPCVDVKDFSQGNFRGPRGFRFKNLPKGFWYAGSADGTGTKTMIFAASGSLVNSPSGLVAMTAMDITRYGGLPLALFNILDVSSLGDDVGSETYHLFQGALRGLKELAIAHQYVVIDGEIAELGLGVGSDDPNALAKFNWGGVMLGAYHDDKMILGNTLREGQVVIVFKECFRDNGISSVRKALAMQYGDEWYNSQHATEAINACATPSAQYDRMFNEANGWFYDPDFTPLINIHLISHLSGGAFKSKFGEDMLAPQGLAAQLSNLFEPPEIMQQCRDWRGMSDEEAYTTWNGGQGALAVVDERDTQDMLALAAKYNILAKAAGVITKEKKGGPRVSIKSQFPGGEWIYY
ncbi:MAG: AIR synthase-related protein [Patescibacteria group bacterium]|nr:AIR synthase-related protein [Patescibacteria group bacterium]